MDNRKSIKDLYLRALVCARIHGRGEEAYDFAGWISVKWLEGKSQNQTLDQSFADYLREQHGNLRRNRGRYMLSRALRSSDVKTKGSEDASDEEAFERVLAGSGHIETNDPESTILERERHNSGVGLASCVRKESILALLSDGWSGEEIADRFGLEPSRISQLRREIEAELARGLGLSEMRERVENGETALEVDWIRF